MLKGPTENKMRSGRIENEGIYDLLARFHAKRPEEIDAETKLEEGEEIPNGKKKKARKKRS